MNLFQALSFQRSAVSASVPIGKPKPIRCEGRCCPDRSAPVFVAIGVKGALALCADCRAWRNRIILAVLPELRRAT